MLFQMLDQLYSARNRHRFVLSTDSYSPSHAITHRIHTNVDAQKLAVLLSPWHGSVWLYRRLANRLTRHDWSVLTFEFSPEILKPNVDQVIESFQTMGKQLTAEVQTIVAAYGYKNVHFIGTSLGYLPLAFAAEGFQGYDEITMVAAASNLALPT